MSEGRKHRPQAGRDGKRDEERETRNTQGEQHEKRATQDERVSRSARDESLDDEPEDVRSDLFEDEDREDRSAERDSWIDERE